LSKNRNRFIGRYIPLFFLLLVVTFTLVSCQGEKLDAASIRGGETRDTLSPYYFNGSIAAAYRIAKEIPEVLDSLYCYCDCKKHMGHKSLLTCYVDTHAVRCDICLDEAYMAYEMHNQGKDTVEIRKAVDKKFSRIRDQRKSGGR
jgi:hypothetical protein